MNTFVPSAPAFSRALGRSDRVIALARVGRWKWTVLALVVGSLAAWLWSRSPDALTASGYSISQAQFESGLLRPVKHPETDTPVIGRDGEARRHFEDLTIYRTNHRDAYGRRVSHIITGLFTNGRVETYKDAGGMKTREIRWREAFFLASEPYKPRTPAQQEALGSVRDYLDRLHVQGVRYRRGWWREPRIATPLFTAVSLLLIAGLWPTFLSLAAFGTLVPPSNGPLAHLPSPPSSHTATSPRPDFSAVHSLANVLEAQFASTEMPAAPPPPSAPSRAHASAPQLNASPQPLPPEAAGAPSKAFGQGQDDFYPTELKPSNDPRVHSLPVCPGENSVTVPRGGT